MRLQVLGKVHPQQGGWRVESVRELTFPDGTWHIAIRESSAVVSIDGVEPLDLVTFVNEVRSVVGGIVDALGFELAIPLRFEATHLLSDGAASVAFIQQGWPELAAAERSDQSQEAWVSEARLAPLIDGAVRDPLIRHAIADAQRAIEAPDDTAFYCYRAIESLRLLYLEGDDIGTARSESWNRLRSDLSLPRREIDAIKQFADRRRHGGHHILSEKDRRQCLMTTRRALRAAIGSAPAPT